MNAFLQQLTVSKRTLVALLEAEVAVFLSHHPEYTGVTWEQGFSPFNDGGPSLLVEEIQFVRKSDSEILDSWDFSDNSDESQFAEKVRAVVKDNEEIFLWLFGTDKRVTITAKKASVKNR